MYNGICYADISNALRFCISDCGDYCNLCAYQKFGSDCSKQLLRDASIIIKVMDDETKRKAIKYDA